MPTYRDVEVADTLPPEDAGDGAGDAAGDAAGRVASTGGPPIASWDLYELGELLGKGGMGSVYRARDRRLDRSVAIKFLIAADPNLTMRFLREARAQARIDHPNVCRVYEAGEVGGRAYIALQLVDGDPLHKAAAAMSLDEKVAVVRDVAVAVHEAHRLGIVHRDLKPANVMVEHSEDGRWIPVVMDFGLAREATVEAGITESGVPLGTPAYMSPEQARGDLHAVDRRSDVYSLGATLYELLTGRLPFPATSLAMALAMAIHDDPPPPRSLVPTLPVDLETVALKCLAKDPTQRYPSARALADDLGRYLDGEPILGRRVSLWHRVRLRARRHRALVILGAWSLAIIVALAVLGVRAWLISRTERTLTAERTRLAQRLGREATEIEGSLREAYQWPLHDTRPDRERVRARMRAIAATHHDLGELGDAIVHDALGRGHLALHEWRDAADELRRAAAAGLQAPELHAALGRALGELYHRELEEARRSGDKGLLARQLVELTKQYLTPALAELEQSRAMGERAALLEARIALYRRDFAAAEQRARAIAEREPGSSEAHKLAADAAYGAAVEAFDHGDYDAARPAIERATTLYTQASEVGRSDTSVYEAAAQAWRQRAELDFRRGVAPRESLDHALEIIDDHALRADPEDAPAYTTKSHVLLIWYRASSVASQDAQRSLLDRIADAASRAVEVDPRDAHAWTSLGNAHIYRGRHEIVNGRMGDAWWSSALDEFGKALAIQPDDLRATNGLGMVHRWLGTGLDSAGRDPTPEYQAALRSYERATTVDPQYLAACANQVDLHTSIAEYDEAVGSDPRLAVDSARRVGASCLAIDPNDYVVLDNLAQAQLALAHYLAEAGGDPTDALASARSYIDRAETFQPESASIWFWRAVAAGTEASFQLRQGTDPTHAVAIGRASLKDALRLAPDSALSYVEAARLDIVEATWAAHVANAQVPALTQALTDAEKAVALDGKLAAARLTAAEICLQIATARPSRAAVDRGIAYVNEALARNPRLFRAQNVRAALLRLR